MPELRNEVPSDAELRAYLLESFSTLADDLSFTCPDHWKDHPDPRVFDDFRHLAGLGFNDFWRRAAQAILQSLHRLNQFPRDDPFWYNTNRRPTIPKLFEFCYRILQEDPADALALWTRAALDVFYGANEFGQAEWKTLWRLPHFDVRWPIFAALHTELNAAPAATDLTRLLRDMEASDQAMPLIRRLAESEAPRIARWARSVLEELRDR